MKKILVISILSLITFSLLGQYRPLQQRNQKMLYTKSNNLNLMPQHKNQQKNVIHNKSHQNSQLHRNYTPRIIHRPPVIQQPYVIQRPRVIYPNYYIYNQLYYIGLPVIYPNYIDYPCYINSNGLQLHFQIGF